MNAPVTPEFRLDIIQEPESSLLFVSVNSHPYAIALPLDLFPPQAQNTPHTCSSSFHAHLFSSNSFHTFCIFSLFSLAASRFCFVRSSRRPRRHILTLYFASVQFPVTFQMKPRLWHSSRAATTSAQSVPWVLESASCGMRRGGGVAHSFGLLRCAGGDALWVCAGRVVWEGGWWEVWEDLEERVVVLGSIGRVLGYVEVADESNRGRSRELRPSARLHSEPLCVGRVKTRETFQFYSYNYFLPSIQSEQFLSL